MKWAEKLEVMNEKEFNKFRPWFEKSFFAINC